MSYEQSVTLHQQDGGMSVQAFADIEGLTLEQAYYCIKRGKVLGARQDARSKRWFVYPPAKLLERPRSRKAVAELPDLLAGADAVAVEAGAESRQSGQCALNVEPEGSCPPAGQQSLQGRAEGLPPAFCSAETRGVLRVLHEAASRQFREGLHYLRLDAHEIAQLYAALDNDRSRVRKMVGKGLMPVGVLRASDSVWHKLQAMCHEGRLL